MINSSRLLPAAAGLLAWLSPPTSAQSIDPSFYYKLSTQFRGDGMKLDVFNGGPKNNLTRLEPDQDVSGQFFTAHFAYRRYFAAPTCVWTSSTAARTTTSRTSSNVGTSRASSGISCCRRRASASG